MKNKMSILVCVFLFGYAVNDVVQEIDATIVTQAWADVAGMNYLELRRDRDFKRAVKDVVSGNCYVQDTHVYC